MVLGYFNYWRYPPLRITDNYFRLLFILKNLTLYTQNCWLTSPRVFHHVCHCLSLPQVCLFSRPHTGGWACCASWALAAALAAATMAALVSMFWRSWASQCLVLLSSWIRHWHWHPGELSSHLETDCINSNITIIVIIIVIIIHSHHHS